MPSTQTHTYDQTTEKTQIRTKLEQNTITAETETSSHSPFLQEGIPLIMGFTTDIIRAVAEAEKTARLYWVWNG